jgi:CrcB protein
MGNIILVGIGGFVGSILRYVISGYAQHWAQSAEFPYGTLVANVVGCLIIGFCSHLAETRGVFDVEARVFVFVGILGGFTTFSTFGNETLNLLRGGELFAALANIAAHLVFGLGAVWMGRLLAHLIWR